MLKWVCVGLSVVFLRVVDLIHSNSTVSSVYKCGHGHRLDVSCVNMVSE